MRGVLQQYGKSSPETARRSEQVLFGLENGYKALRGRLTVLRDSPLMKQKRDAESALRQYVAQQPALQARIGGAGDEIAAARQGYRQIEAPYGMIEGGRALNGKYA